MKLKRTLWFCMLVLILGLGQGFAQFAPHSVHRNYTIEHGLPSNETYDVYQDRDGYIWIATDRGVARFDGYDFKVFTTEEGLHDNTIFKIREDHQGRLWFAGYSNQFSYYENGTIHPYWHNKKIIDKLPNKGVVNEFHFDEQGMIHLSVFHRGYYTVDSTGHITKNPEPMDKAYRYNLVMEGGKVFLAMLSGRILYNPSGVRIVGEEPGVISSYRDLKDVTNGGIVYAILQSNGRPVVCLYTATTQRTEIGLINTDLSIHKYYEGLDHAFGMTPDPEDGVWVLLDDRAVHYSEVTGEINRIIHMGKDSRLSGMCWDKEGGIWISSTMRGLYYVPDNGVTVLNHEDRSKNIYFTGVVGDGKGNIIAQSALNGAWKVEDDYSVTLINGSEYRQTLNQVKSWPGDSTMFFSSISNFEWKNGQLNHLKDLRQNVTIAVGSVDTLRYTPAILLRDRKGDYWGHSSLGIFRYRSGEIEFYPARGEENYKGLFTQMIETHDGRVYGAGNRGLWRLENGEFVFLGEQHPLLAKRVSDLKVLPDDKVWIATRGAGIVIIDGEEIDQITTTDGLNSNMLTRLELDQAGNVWVCSKKGLNKITITPEINVESFSLHNGLPTNEIEDIHIEGSDVWMATKTGLAHLDLNRFNRNAVAPLVQITGLKISNKDTIPQSGYELSHKQNAFLFTFKGISYRSNCKLKYHYHVEGLPEAKGTTEFNELFFPVIPPGEYTFVVQASNEDGVMSETPATLAFTIHPPFYKTIWFTILWILGVNGIIAGVFFIRLKNLERRRKLENEIAKFKKQALSSQMNPHFIFNSLNSIQNFILKNNRKEANRYLAKFAKLIRMALDNSITSMVSLSQEINMLTIYMDLERLRFKDKFSYEFIVDPKLDTELLRIPSMLIQPFVENAIWHGIMHKEGNGKIEIILQKSDQLVTCTIEDDGIGRKRSLELKRASQKDHRSVGMTITEKRLELINALREFTLNFEIKDLEDPEGNPTGTCVTFTIPYEMAK